ncbi:hypothetical protein RJ640_006491, partial [Escallonia rubra]
MDKTPRHQDNQRRIRGEISSFKRYFRFNVEINGLYTYTGAYADADTSNGQGLSKEQVQKMVLTKQLEDAKQSYENLAQSIGALKGGFYPMSNQLHRWQVVTKDQSITLGQGFAPSRAP